MGKLIKLLGLFLFALVTIGSEVYAEFTLPDVNAANVQEFINRLVAEAPWAAHGGNIQTVGPMSVQLIPQLTNDPVWQKLAAERKPRVSILIETLGLTEKQMNLARPEVTRQWAQDINTLAAELSADKLTIQSLTENASAEIKWLSTHDPRAFVTGLINSLPPPERGQFFKMNSVAKQLQALLENPSFTTEAVRKNFRASAFGLEPDQVSKEGLTDLLREALAREEKLVATMRAIWLLQETKALSLQGIQPQRATAAQLDPFNAPEKLEEFFKALSGGDQKSGALLHKIAKAQVVEQNYQIQNVQAQEVISTLRVEEVSPELGATRGCLMHDCSREAWGFAYTPTEYVFLVRNERDQPVAFVVAAYVLSGAEVKTFFVHDFGGAGVTMEVAGQVMHALHEALPQLGFERMTMNAANGNNGQFTYWFSAQVQKNPRGQLLNQTYLDGPLRQNIKRATGYPYDYDLATNQNNLAVNPFTPSPEVMQNMRVSITQGQDTGPAAAVKSKPEALLRAISLFNANPEAGVTREMLMLDGIQSRDLHRLFAMLKNANRAPVEQYYENLEKIFADYEIKLSRKFIREHEFLFWEGHLNAANAITTEDAAMQALTLRWTVMMMKRLPNPQIAMNVISQNRDFLRTNEAFQKYLESFTGHAPNEAARIEFLMDLGFNFDHLRENQEAMARLTNAESPKVRQWALAALTPAQLGQLPAQTVRGIAKDLDVDDDDIPRRASKMLLHTNNQDPEVIRELMTSFEEEDDDEIMAQSGLSLLKIGQRHPEFEQRLGEYLKSNPGTDLSEQIQRLLPAAENCEKMMTGRRGRQNNRAG